MSKNTAVAEPEKQNYRLPRTVVPSRYDIRLAPDLTNFKFTGETVTHVEVKEPVKEILLNSIELEIHSAEIVNDKGASHKATTSLDEPEERLLLKFDQEISAGKWQVKIKFTGTLNDKLHGFYRSTYKDEKGNQKVLATTQFEATDARRAFPCWDEPDFKATYKTTLEVDEHLTAISNTAIESEKKLGNGKKEVVFKETMKMSTYLVAFVVGEFEATEPVMADGKPIRIWAVPGKGKLSKFSEGIAKHSLEFFAKYYGVPYPGDKLDLVAIPDFAFGAMENLGCVTFRENALLVDEKTSSHAEQERVADVVAHEIAHMWFGDLTTMSWWNGIWLNEAFATFAEMMAVNAWKPEWKRWETFGAMRAAAMIVDGLKSTRPIEYEVRRPEECNGMFDVLTYEKGASVLRQLEQYLEEPVFQKGISLYLDRHQFANTETSDLWAALEEASKQPIVSLMESWIYYPGHPMVSVEVDASGKNVKLSQQRFFYLPENAEGKQLFHVPVLIRAKCGGKTVTKKILLKEESATVEMPDKVEWVVVNEGGHGFYRVRYSADLQSKLTADVFNILSPIERFNLVNDTWAAVVSGNLPLKQYLELISIFANETDKNVWSVIAGSFSYLDRVLPDSARSDFEGFVRKLMSGAHQKLGWDRQKSDNELTAQLRGVLIGTLGTVGNCPETQKKAREYYAKYKADRNSVDPNVVPALVGIIANSGDKAQYDEFLNEFKSAKTPQDEERYLYALAGFPQKELLTQTLERTINGEVRTQNAPYLLRSVMMNRHGRELAWEFAKKNWKQLIEKFPDNSIPRMVEGITALVDEKLEKDVVEFFKKNPVSTGAKTVDQHMERLHVAVKFKAREKDALGTGFKA
jgi:puromycin-sensitive aminopeptidase